MKKSNLFAIIITAIISPLIVSGFAFADDTWHGLDTTVIPGELVKLA
jgi:hypothetical protein